LDVLAAIARRKPVLDPRATHGPTPPYGPRRSSVPSSAGSPLTRQPHTATPHGRLMLTVLGGLAEFEKELIHARTTEGRARAKARGVKLDRKPKLTEHRSGRRSAAATATASRCARSPAGTTSATARFRGSPPDPTFCVRVGEIKSTSRSIREPSRPRKGG
jgi:hypothetical protein